MTRYVVADLNGRSIAYFDQRADAREALRGLEVDDPDSIDELYLVGYAKNGARVFGPESAEDVLRSKRTLEPTAHQWAAVDLGPIMGPKKRVRYKKPGRSKPFDPCDTLALA